MTPAQAIADLDRELAENGSTFTLARRQRGADNSEWSVRGFMRGLKPSEITDGVGQGAHKLALSPTYLIGSIFETDPPKRGDFVLFQQRSLAVDAVEIVLLADVAVRFNLIVAG